MAVNVFASPLPFSNKQIKAHAVTGSSIQDIIDLICPPQLKAIGIGAVVEINGYKIKREYWHLVKPKEGTIVNIRIIPQGGKGGKKSPIAAILTLAVAIAAPYLGATIAASISASTSISLATTVTLSKALGIAIGVIGSMLISALVPPPRPSNAGITSNPAESPTQFIEGAQNQLLPYGVVPICLGTNRMFPPKAARPYTEVEGKNQYVRELFTYGWGKLVIQDRKLGETALSEFNSIDMVDKLEGDLHEPTDLYSNDVFQEDFNVLLREADGWVVRTTQQNVDEAIVDITFPRGFTMFSSTGARVLTLVELEMQFAPTGTSDWSVGGTFKPISGVTFTAASVPIGSTWGLTSSKSYRRDSIIINKLSGEINYLSGNPSIRVSDLMPSHPNSALKPIVPPDSLLLTTFLVTTTWANVSGVVTTDTFISEISDNRQPADIGPVLELPADFAPSYSGLDITIADGSIRYNELRLEQATSEAYRHSTRLQFPTAGQYDIRIRRVTEDTENERILDKAYLSAIKSITYRAPVNLQGISGTAMRILGTDQLNGTISQYNVVASSIILSYEAESDYWIERVTSNPADIYRYVLQGNMNSFPLNNDEIDIEGLEDWHNYCAQQGYTYNRVIDYDTNLNEVLKDIAAAGSASPTFKDGKRSVVIDRIKEDIVQMVTPRNSWGYKADMTYPQLPHAFRVQFRNSTKGYQQDERIVYADGYNENNATIFETLEYQSCTDSNLAWKNGRRYLATAILRPEVHSFNMDVENLVATRGDRIKLEHDIPMVGIGDGRIKEIFWNSASEVEGLRLDDTITVPDSSPISIRIRPANNPQVYLPLLNPGSGDSTEFYFPTPVTNSTFDIGDLVSLSKTGGELDLVITGIIPSGDLTAAITAVDYAPAIFQAESGIIPAWNSNLTIPLEFIRPLPPKLASEPQSDESVMIRNIDGSLTTRVVITLINPNGNSVIEPLVLYRLVGASTFITAQVLEATPTRVVLAGLDDSNRYDIRIYYRRIPGDMVSIPLQINNYLVVGKATPPDDVQGFRITLSGQTALLSWLPNDDIDLSHYVIRFSSATMGARWETAQLLDGYIDDNRISYPARSGTFFIKAVDLLGYESVNAAAIVAQGLGDLTNVVEILQEHPDFLGDKVNTYASSGVLRLADATLREGYYYFHNSIDLTGVYMSSITANIRAYGEYQNNIFTMDDMFAEADIFGSEGGNDIFTMDDMFNVTDIFGIGADAWEIELQARFTNDDSLDSGTEWTAWETFVAGGREFRAAEFRVWMRSYQDGITPVIDELSVIIDMPDRIERGDDLIVPAIGIRVDYSPHFKANPAVTILLQDGDAADEIIFEPTSGGLEKDETGFRFRVFNRTSMVYVERSFDFISSGYGRVLQ